MELKTVKSNDERTPEVKYKDAFDSFTKNLADAAIKNKRLSLTKVAEDAGLNRTCFYKPNFSNQDLNEQFTSLGEKIKNWNERKKSKQAVTYIDELEGKVKTITSSMEAAQLQSASLLAREAKLQAKNGKLVRENFDLKKQIDELTYELIKPEQKSNYNQASTSYFSTVIKFSPDNYIYKNGYYQFENDALRNEAWYSVRREVSSELKKTIPTRVYILVGLPGSGKTTWSENFEFYLDKRSIVIDCCNLSYFERSDWVSLIKSSAPEASICAVYFDTPFEVILERNESRPFDRALPKDKLEHYRINFQPVDYHKETHFNELIIVRH